MSQWGNDTKVYTDDGKDITAELGITNINIEVNLGEMTKVHLTCYVKGTEVHDYDMTHVIKTGLLPSPSYAPYKTAKDFYAGTDHKSPFYDHEMDALKYGLPGPTSKAPQTLGNMKPEAILDQFKVQKPISPEEK
jgi:hypothetical protein